MARLTDRARNDLKCVETFEVVSLPVKIGGIISSYNITNLFV